MPAVAGVASSIMPTNHSRGGSSRTIRPNRDKNQKRTPNPGPEGTSGSDWRSRSKFEHIPSISRSSGVERDGDTLKDPGVQEEYRKFLQQKLDAYWKRYCSSSNSEDSDAQKPEVESNILIQFRKLREGISSSRRHDQFAIEVYETSLWLSIIFRSHAQTIAILSPLLPDLYLSVKPTVKGEASSSLTVLLASLHSLECHYPSQRAFFDLSKSLPPSFTLLDDHQVWLRDLSCSLRRGGYSHFRRLTQKTTLGRLVASETPDQGPDLALLSLQTLVASLRDRLRLSAWGTVRSAYREFALPLCDTTTWLSNVLLLEVETGKQNTHKDGDHVQLWFTSRENLGEVVRKDGMDGRWAVKLKK